ncbi:DNA recombination protein RmuC [Desulfocucumis palustris]|nr:DNA recombination protein RmuC [Desulfocucumis palustris]
MLNDFLSVMFSLINLLMLLLLVVHMTRTSARLSQLEYQLSSADKNQERLERIFREELVKNINLFNDSVLSHMSEIAGLQRNQLDTFSRQLSELTASNEKKLEQMRDTVEQKLKQLQEDNSLKLEQMRATVDEKLHASLEKRLGESFKLVSERLELVHKGLGEMQTLASGVGDLKKVLTNVKTRGTWGEIQLGSLLEQVLTPEQYESNVSTKKGASERVEFAIKLPGRNPGENVVWLPIDAKFPLEDYQRLLDAREQANQAEAEEARKLLENRIKYEAKNIREKYIDPPNTTDFGIMFLPVEGLYAEVLRKPGLCESLQRDHRVVLTGPTTLAALLNSLQMGFRTLAVEKRSSEVWALLGAVKTEFIKFGDMLDKTRKKLQEASNTMETAASKSRAIQRKLKNVQELPAEEPFGPADNPGRDNADNY